MKIDLTVRAQLISDHTCSAAGITISSSSPVLALCRKLVELGHDPSLPLEAWRGDTLCLRVRSIGEAAGLEINGEGTGFRGRSKPGRASPMRPIAEAAEVIAPAANMNVRPYPYPVGV